MFQKSWKFLLLAPLTLTLITACGDKKHKDEPGSRFQGFWLQKGAARDLELAKQGRNPEEVSNILCGEALKPGHREAHGLSKVNEWSGKLLFHAYFVTTGGETYQLVPDFRLTDPVMRYQQHAGQIREDGTFNRAQTGTTQASARPWESTPADASSSMSLAPDGKSLTLRKAGVFVAIYTRMSGYEMEVYANAMSECAVGHMRLVPEAQDAAYGYQQNPGTDPGYNDQGEVGDRGQVVEDPRQPTRRRDPKGS